MNGFLAGWAWAIWAGRGNAAPPVQSASSAARKPSTGTSYATGSGWP